MFWPQLRLKDEVWSINHREHPDCWRYDIFGGGSSGSSTTTTTASSPYTAQQKKAQKKILDVYGKTIGQGQEVYTGTRVAPLTAAQETGIKTASDYINFFAPATNIPLYEETGSTLKNILSGEMGAQALTPEQTSQYFSRVYEEPAKKRWSEEILPTTQEAYAGPGYWGSSRAKAEMEAQQDLSDWLGTQRGQVEWDVLKQNQAIEESKAGRALSAVGLESEYATLPTTLNTQRLAGLTTATGVAGMEQTQQQNEINAAMQKFVEENRLTDPENMNIILSMLGMPYGTSTSTSETTGEKADFDWGSALATAAIAALSDKRLKENIKPISDALEKLKTLTGNTYNFIFDKNNQNAGIMAQDLEMVLPEGITEIGGYKHIKLDAVLALIINAVKELADKMEK